MWDSFQFQHRNPSGISIQTFQFILNASRYTNNNRISEDPKMNIVVTEIKKWNAKYLRKLENHTNALAVILLGNSENTQRLKRYTVLSLPDRLYYFPNRGIKIIPKRTKEKWIFELRPSA